MIPYVCDQLAMARLTRAAYALMVSLLPATATVIGIVVLGQVPSWVEVTGVGAGRRGRGAASGARHVSSRSRARAASPSPRRAAATG